MLIGLLLLACAPGPTLPEDPRDSNPQPVCAWSAVEIGLEDDPGLGFSAAEVLDVAEGPRFTTLTWDWLGGTTGFESALSADGAPAWNTAELVSSHTGEPWTDETGSSAAELCPPHILLPVIWTARTEDGRLDEALRVDVALDSADVARVVVIVDHGDLDGTGPRMEIDPLEWDIVEYEFVAQISSTEGGAVGTLGEIAVSANRSGQDEDSAWGEGYFNDVGRWPTAK